MEIKIKNPLSESWYADPEARFYGGKYYIYVTRSAPYEKQLNHDCFISSDLQNWEIKKDIIDIESFPWVKKAVWAPTVIEKNGRYYYIFASNDIQNDDELGGLEIGVSDSPEGPFISYLGKPLIDRFINGAQPIDAHLFKDDDGTVYLYYGGWKHCNVAVMNETMDGFVPFENGDIFREITPKDYVEGPCMMKKDGLYYFMWSCGAWGDGTYRVDYSVSDSPLGKFRSKGTVLSKDGKKYEGTGHNGFIRIEGTNDYLCAYHRRKVDVKHRDARFLCIDKIEFDGERMKSVVLTDECVYTTDKTV